MGQSHFDCLMPNLTFDTPNPSPASLARQPESQGLMTVILGRQEFPTNILVANIARAKDKVTLSFGEAIFMEVSRKPSAVWFPDWVVALRQQRLPALHQQQYRFALIQFLRFCKQTHQRATVEAARQFMRDLDGQRRLGTSQARLWKDALNWFFRNGKKYPASGGPTPMRDRQENAERSGITGSMDAPTNCLVGSCSCLLQRNLIKAISIF